MEKREISPIAIIHSDFKEKFGIPRNSGRSPSSKAVIELLPPFNVPEAVKELSSFSHVWLLFDFSLAHTNTFSPTVRPPRLGGNERVGVFASRSPFRPNSIGLSVVKLDSVDISDGVKINVLGADILDGTPIYDIKPYIPFADCIPNAVGGYADKHFNHKLNVLFPERLLSIIPEDKRKALIECLEDDPRPSYQDDDRVYGMAFDKFNVKFRVSNNILTVTEIENL